MSINTMRLKCEVFQGPGKQVQRRVDEFLVNHKIAESAIHRVDYSVTYDANIRQVIHCACVWYRVPKEWN